MFPGMNPKQLKQVMRQMGLTLEELDAVEVIIKTNDKEYLFQNPEVQIMKMQGKETFQIIGEYEIKEREIKIEISDEDIKTVMEQTNVSKEKAERALKESKGDIARAIIKLTE